MNLVNLTETERLMIVDALLARGQSFQDYATNCESDNSDHPENIRDAKERASDYFALHEKVRTQVSHY